MNRNIKLAYILSFLSQAHFWWAVWLLYYLRFTDATGVGLLITTQLLTSLLAELPTGAIADLIGQKKSLQISFLLAAIGFFLMGAANSFLILAVSILIMNIGTAFNSGSFEAIIYDSLKTLQQTTRYQKVLSHTQSIKSLTVIAVSFIGGLMYAISPRLPFLVTAVFFLFALIASCLLKEPPIQKENLESIRDNIKQLTKGAHHLFQKDFLWVSIGLLFISSVVVIGYELLDDFVVVASVPKPEYLGITYAVLGLIGASSAQLVPRVSKRLGNLIPLVSAAIVLLISYLLTPRFSTVVILGLVGTRVISNAFINNISSTLINDHTPSKDRATTLSTFSMLSQIPLALVAPVISKLVGLHGAYIVSMWIGVIGLIMLTIYLSGIKAKTLMSLRKH